MSLKLKTGKSVVALIILSGVITGCNSNSASQMPTDPAAQKAAIVGSAPPPDVVAKMKAGQAAANAAYQSAQGTMPHPPANTSGQ